MALEKPRKLAELFFYTVATLYIQR